MKEFLTEPENESFCNRYLKERLIKLISDNQGICDIVFREKTSEILRKHFSITHSKDDESQKNIALRLQPNLSKARSSQ